MQHEPNPEPRFEVVTGECRFFLGERQLYATREQAFLFDSQTGTMLKHGAQADVLAKHKECVAAYQAIGVDIQDLLVIGFEPEHFDAELFTRFVSTSGFLAAWYAVHKREPGLKKTL